MGWDAPGWADYSIAGVRVVMGAGGSRRSFCAGPGEFSRYGEGVEREKRLASP